MPPPWSPDHFDTTDRSRLVAIERAGVDEALGRRIAQALLPARSIVVRRAAPRHRWMRAESVHLERVGDAERSNVARHAFRAGASSGTTASSA